MTSQQMIEIEEMNKVKHIIEFEFVNDDGDWQKTKIRTNSKEYANLQIKAINKNSRMRNPVMINL